MIISHGCLINTQVLHLLFLDWVSIPTNGELNAWLEMYMLGLPPPSLHPLAWSDLWMCTIVCMCTTESNIAYRLLCLTMRGSTNLPGLSVMRSGQRLVWSLASVAVQLYCISMTSSRIIILRHTGTMVSTMGLAAGALLLTFSGTQDGVGTRYSFYLVSKQILVTVRQLI